MVELNRFWLLMGIEAVVSIIAAYMYDLMTGFWTFTGLMVATALVFTGLNFSYAKEALGATPSKVGTTVLLILVTVALVPFYSGMFDFPQSASIILAVSTTLSFGWAHVTLEPAGQ